VQLPAGVRVVPEREGFVARTDIVAGNLNLPTGTLAIDDFYYGDPQVTLDVAAKRPEFRVTLADSVKYGVRGGGVALATLVTGARLPVRWKQVGVMGTDGGTGGFASAEAADRMVQAAKDAAGSDALHTRQLDVLMAADHNGVGELHVGHGLNLFTFSPGLGDGGYSVYAGMDEQGGISRVVMDGGLLHLAWPR
jgi:hypothetical protein